jgi:hypothetical protein
MFLAIDRVSKFTYIEFHDHARKMAGSAFLRNVVAAFLYKIDKVLTYNGMAFAGLSKNRKGPGRRATSFRDHTSRPACGPLRLPVDLAAL